MANAKVVAAVESIQAKLDALSGLPPDIEEEKAVILGTDEPKKEGK